jgi:ABC-type phosphate transport system substrate-binding protein
MARPLPLLASLALLAALAAGSARGAEPARGSEPHFLVVAHPSVTVGELPRDQLSRLFLKKDTQWPDGATVLPVEPLHPGLREAFARQVHQRSAAAIAAYWNALIFAGRELPPLEKAGDADVLAYVRATPGAIGYVSAGADTAGVRIVLVGRGP